MTPPQAKIVPATSHDRKQWDDYVLAHPNGLAYQLFAWKTAIENAYGFKCPYLMAKKGARVCGIFPMAHIHLPLCSGTLVSLPYCDAGGLLADSKEIESLLLKHAIAYANEHGIKNLEVRAVEAFGYEPASETLNREKVRMVLELPSSADTLLAGFKSKMRSQVRKPMKDGLNVRLGSVELLDDFYPVFGENMRDLGSPVHSKEWIRQVLQAHGSRAVCGVVYMPDGEPAAGGVILCHDRTVSIPWASSLRKLNRWNPNMLLYWAFLEYAANTKHALFDFGRSTPEEGTYRFKAQWGASPKPLYWARFDTHVTTSETEIPRPRQEPVSQGNKHRETAERLIQNMPLPLSQWLGGQLRRYISL